MTSQHFTFPTRLFYSYCHEDEQYKDSMEKALALLKKEKLLKSWSDQNILPGQQISKKVREEMNNADIMVFLFSKEFIASTECVKEWECAKQIVATGKLPFRIPIILKDCAWQDMLANDDVKALPKDGTPIAEFQDEDAAWQQIYEGIKAVVNRLRNTFTPKQEFLQEMEKTDFLSLQHIKLQDIFIFLPLSCYTSETKDGLSSKEEITNQEQLLKKRHMLIHGEEMSGKTALGRYLFLSLAEMSAPVLHIDLNQVYGKPKESVFRDTYRRQFNGDYSLWKQKSNKTLILDNLSSDSNLVDFIVFAKDFFDRVIVTLSSDVFNSFFIDEIRLADFVEMKIESLTHNQQEKLIKKRLALSDRNEPVTDGYIDQVENRVNSIIISKKIVPRYPFFVLCILQTYEGYMPSNLSITSYGHCYHVLIIANLIKAGISREDADINTCFNFAERLAFKIYKHTRQHGTDAFDFEGFVEEYREKFLIKESILNRLKSPEYGIITEGGHFKTAYMHYFFLGKFLAKGSDTHKAIIEQMSEESYVTSNYLTLIFIIHHSNDSEIIDDILLRTMCTLDTVQPAVLDRDETKRFGNIVGALPESVLSSNNVEEERGKERNIRDISDRQVETEDEMGRTGNENSGNDLYRILKNNEIMGQILRNKYGSLERTKIEEIIETITNSGLRLINYFLADEDEVADFARYLHEKHPEHDIYKIKIHLQFFSFLWTMVNVEKIVSAINTPEIKEAVNRVVRQQSTPAYDLIGYFSQLDSARELTKEVKQKLDELLKKHNDPFVKKVLSIRTQYYMNTHRSRAPIEQSVCSLLNVKYGGFKS